jgi:hypothetical protein
MNFACPAAASDAGIATPRQDFFEILRTTKPMAGV